MLLDISKLSKHSKEQWVFKFQNESFDDIVNLILNKMEYDCVVLTIWSLQVDLFSKIDYELVACNPKFSALKLSKNSSIQFMNPEIYDEIRFFDMNIYCNYEKVFNIKSDNYGEYTSINMDKTIDEERLLKILDNVFK